MPLNVVFCLSSLCATDKIDIERIKQEINKSKIAYYEIKDLCSNLADINSMNGDIIIVGCNGKVIKPKVAATNKRIVYTDIREQCLWIYEDQETIHREILLQLKLSLHKLRFMKTSEKSPLNCFKNKVTEYVEVVNELGPNPFKM